MNKLIYIAGALNADAVNYIKNLHRMNEYADKVRKLGCSVFVPGLDFLMGLQLGNWDYQDYFDNSQPILERSDAIFVVPFSEKSQGTAKEVKKAQDLEIPVFHQLGRLAEFLRR